MPNKPCKTDKEAAVVLEYLGYLYEATDGAALGRMLRRIYVECARTCGDQPWPERAYPLTSLFAILKLAGFEQKTLVAAMKSHGGFMMLVYERPGKSDYWMKGLGEAGLAALLLTPGAYDVRTPIDTSGDFQPAYGAMAELPPLEAPLGGVMTAVGRDFAAAAHAAVMVLSGLPASEEALSVGVAAAAASFGQVVRGAIERTRAALLAPPL